MPDYSECDPDKLFLLGIDWVYIRPKYGHLTQIFSAFALLHFYLSVGPKRGGPAPSAVRSSRSVQARNGRLDHSLPNGRYRRTAGPRRQAETECPIFGVGRPFSNVWGIGGPRGGDVAIERRGRHTEAVRDLSDADIGIGQQRSRDIKIVFRQL